MVHCLSRWGAVLLFPVLQIQAWVWMTMLPLLEHCIVCTGGYGCTTGTIPRIYSVREEVICIINGNVHRRGSWESDT